MELLFIFLLIIILVILYEIMLYKSSDTEDAAA